VSGAADNVAADNVAAARAGDSLAKPRDRDASSSAGHGPPGRATELLAADPAKAGELLDAIRRLSGELDLDVLLARAMEVSTHLVEADRSSLFIYDRADDELWSKVAQGLETQVLRFPASKGLAGSCARTGEVVNVPDAYNDERFNPEFDKKTGYRTSSVLCMPMKDARGHVLGVIQVLNRAGGAPFDALDEAMLETLGSHVAVFIENAQLHEAIEALFESFVRAASTAIEERDPATSGHSRRVAKYAVNLARAAHRAKITEFTRSRLRQLRYASLLHDFGKIGVRESVLAKQNKLTDDRVELVAERFRRRELERRVASASGHGTTNKDGQDEQDSLGRQHPVHPVHPCCSAGDLDLVRRANVPGHLSDEDVERLKGLAERGVLTSDEVERLTIRRGNLTDDEWKDMRSHADRSVHILSEIAWPEEYARVPEIAHRHHEKLDGSGYPGGLSGDEVDTDARILGVVDIYDALTAQDRPYKPAMPHEKARAILEEDAGAGRLDAELVRLFFEWRLHEVEYAGDTQVVLHAS